MRLPLPFWALLTWLTVSHTVASGQSLRHWRQLAGTMVDEEVAAAGIKNDRILAAMRSTPRHEFVPANQRSRAYLDMALPIGASQTISPPFIVAYMTEQVDPQPSDRVLEIGTGSGYQAAVLSPLVSAVYTIEIVESLSRKAGRTLRRLEYDNVHTRAGDGFQGWPEEAPFDKIIVTCSPEKVPLPLIDQLVDGGRMIVPVGERYQQTFYLYRKQEGKLVSEALRATLFVPMTGQAEEGREVRPDPLRPQIINGDFELASEEGLPDAWHYQRQLTLVTDPRQAPAGKQFVRFTNDEPGKGCRALQGFAIDGRQIAQVRLAFSIQGQDIRAGQNPQQLPKVVITFYDQRRAVVGHERVGPFQGTFPWRREETVLAVPLAAREAIVRIGLLGGVGQVALDDIQLRVEP